MKQSAAREPQEHGAEEDGQDLELLKAVAQAWHAQTGNPKRTMEFNAQRGRRSFKPRPTRFGLESVSTASRDSSSSSARWDFAESLLDSYEIVTLSRKLEASLSLDEPSPAAQLFRAPARKRRRRSESKHSLRSLFSKVYTNRVDSVDTPREESK